MTQSALHSPEETNAMARAIDHALDQVVQGDEAGMTAFMAEDGARLWAICLSALDDDALAERAMISALRSIVGAASLRPQAAHQRHWCAAIARHAAVNLLREGAGPAMRLPHQPPLPEHALDYSEARLEQAMSAMDPARHEALRRVWTSGETYDSLARYFQIPLDDVRDWLRGAIVQLRDAGWGHQSAEGALADPNLLFLAAEYALGVLTASEAAMIEEMMAIDPDLEQAVAGWCVGLAEIGDTLTPVPVDPVQQARILSYVDLPRPVQDADPDGVWGVLWPAVWGLGGAVIALLALYLWN